MSQGSQTAVSTVILLEAEPSLRRLIMLGLRHQGLKVVEAASLNALDAADIEAADLLVMDIDNDYQCDWPLLYTVQQHPQLAALPSVVLSWETPDTETCPTTLPIVNDPQRFTFLPKPFDARAMYQKITELLSMRISEKNATIEHAEAALLASYQRPTASIWPLVTAIGMLLVVIGLLIHLAITAIGILIVAVSLLFWILGTKPAQYAPPQPTMG